MANRSFQIFVTISIMTAVAGAAPLGSDFFWKPGVCQRAVRAVSGGLLGRNLDPIHLLAPGDFAGNVIDAFVGKTVRLTLATDRPEGKEEGRSGIFVKVKRFHRSRSGDRVDYEFIADSEFIPNSVVGGKIELVDGAGDQVKLFRYDSFSGTLLAPGTVIDAATQSGNVLYIAEDDRTIIEVDLDFQKYSYLLEERAF